MTPRDLERAREIVSLYVKEAFWPDYETLTTAIAAAIAEEREWCARDCALLAARVCGDCEGDGDREQAFRDAERAIRDASGRNGHISTAPDPNAVHARTHDTTALAAALSTWDDRAFNAMLALPHGALVVQELRAIRERGGA